MPDHSDPFAQSSHLPAILFAALVLMTIGLVLMA
jgi:hypothetical protein